MQENNRRLIDEAIEGEPVKNSFRLLREFIMLNKTFTLTAIGIFILLNVLGSIPVIALIFAVLAGIYGISLQIHAGRTLYGTESIDTFLAEIESSKINEVLSRHVSTASGVYVGWMLLMMLLLLILGFALSFSGAVTQKMDEAAVLMALTQFSGPIILIALLFSYVQPLVHSNILLANSFGEGLKAVFTLFSKDVWRSAMQKVYFVYIAKIGIVVGILLVVIVGITTTVVTIPGVGLIFMILILALMYLLMIYMSFVSMMARRMVEE